MIENKSGEIALTYYQPIPKMVRVGETQYIFSVRNDLSICWIKKEHVDTILAMKKNCCGGTVKRNIFRYTTDVELRRHQFGGR